MEAHLPVPHSGKVCAGVPSSTVCREMSDHLHMEKFNHNLLENLQVDASWDLVQQGFDHFLVLDLEGKVEILEFPVVVIDAKTAGFVDAFHRFVRPCRMGEQRVNEYIEGKYGKIGVDRVWHDTAIPFIDVLQEFENWMTVHNFLSRDGSLNRAAFVTCGNWDVKTKIPQQCHDSGVKLPRYFMEWINLKDIYLNFYKRKATGMKTMLRELGIPLVGNHHLGIDDAKNIATVLQRMLSDGAAPSITARRISSSEVEFLFKNRIR
ncbi:polynucleotidyl transferase, ribonuclease H-like superfamily protein isoform X2 [Wolffia australiana]